jgi:hypothetical protein
LFIGLLALKRLLMVGAGNGSALWRRPKSFTLFALPAVRLSSAFGL